MNKRAGLADVPENWTVVRLCEEIKKLKGSLDFLHSTPHKILLRTYKQLIIQPEVETAGRAEAETPQSESRPAIINNIEPSTQTSASTASEMQVLRSEL